ncbi:MAG: hypothetical protein WAL71_13700 [Terriglobales bacterium]|jgi:hypothetical protein
MQTETNSMLVTGNLWRELYRAALSESDRSRLSERIAEAEWALVLRARELFHTPGDHIEEQSAIDDAMYALHALRNTRREGVEATSRREAA